VRRGTFAGTESRRRRVWSDEASWFAVYLQFSSGLSSSSLIVAVSTTSDPTGTFCRYRIGNPTSETFLQDFPMLGVRDDKVVVSYNGFSFPLTFPIFLGAGYYVLNKADLTACSASLNMTRVPPNPSRATPFPADMTVANPGPERLVDVYFGALLPPQTGGCPGRDPIAFLADGFATTVVTCLTAAATTFGAHSRNVSRSR